MTLEAKLDGSIEATCNDCRVWIAKDSAELLTAAMAQDGWSFDPSTLHHFCPTCANKSEHELAVPMHVGVTSRAEDALDEVVDARAANLDELVKQYDESCTPASETPGAAIDTMEF